MFSLTNIFQPLTALRRVAVVANSQLSGAADDGARVGESATLMVRDTQGKYQQNIALQPGLEIEIGRYLGSSITTSRPRFELPNAAVSARHAYLGLDDSGVFIIDVGTEGAGSRNGTFVNGVRVQPKRKFYLNTNDEVWLGKPHGDMSERIIVNADRANDSFSVSFQTFAAR
jgi:pSer/pThr/pTyr-binding forkhead associated (FHA) protein